MALTLQPGGRITGYGGTRLSGGGNAGMGGGGATDDQLAMAGGNRGLYLNRMRLSTPAKTPNAAGQIPDFRMVNLTGNASAQGHLPSTGAIIGPNGVKSWGSQNTTFNGTTAPNNFTLGANLNGGRGGYAGMGAVNGAGGAVGGGTGAGGGGAGTGGRLATRLGNQDQADLNSANAANDARYQESLNTNQQGFANQMDFLGNVLGQQQAALQGAGGTAHELENRRLGKQLGSSQQSLFGRGLGNSTVVDSMAKGYQTDSALVQNAIDEGVNRDKLNILSQYGQQGNANIGNSTAQRIGIVGSKSDLPPNTGASQQLLSQPGAQGGRLGGGTRNGQGGGFTLNQPSGDNESRGTGNPLADYINRIQNGQGQQTGFNFGTPQSAAGQFPQGQQQLPDNSNDYQNNGAPLGVENSQPSAQQAAVRSQLESYGFNTQGFSEAELQAMVATGNYDRLPKYIDSSSGD